MRFIPENIRFIPKMHFIPKNIRFIPKFEKSNNLCYNNTVGIGKKGIAFLSNQCSLLSIPTLNYNIFLYF